MQIHELTQEQLNEGFMDTLKNVKNSAYGRAIDSIGKSIHDADRSASQSARRAAAAVGQTVKRAAGAVGPAVKSAASGVASAVTNNPATRAYDRSTGVFGKAPSYASTAQNAAQKLSKKGFGAQYQAPSADWQEKLKKVQTDPAIKQYIQSLVAAWAKSSPAVVKNTPEPPTNTPPTNTPPTPNYGATGAGQLTGTPSSITSTPLTPQASNQPISVGGQKIDPNDPKNASTIAALRRQGAIKENVSPEEDQYADAFVRWSDDHLKTRESSTGETIDMDDVRELPDISDALNSVLEPIVNTRGTPKQATALAKYFEIAVAGVQAVAQAVRNKNPQARTSSIAGAAAAKPVMQQRLRALGVTPAQVQQMGQMLRVNSGDKTFKSTGNPQVDALLMTLGMTPI